MPNCRYCGQKIEQESGQWVEILSGDEGGTYDYCPANASGHAPEKTSNGEKMANNERPKRSADYLSIDQLRRIANAPSNFPAHVLRDVALDLLGRRLEEERQWERSPR